MTKQATSRKLPDQARFLDLSDYARPLASWLARRLADSRVRAPHVTWAWAAIGLCAAYCYGKGGYGLALLGGLGMQAKNVLDAVDGSLARLQGRPSRLGRFLDSIWDALIAAALSAGVAVSVARDRPTAYALGLGAAAWVLGLLQGSVFNYFYVRYRARRGGDTTSRVDETLSEEDRRSYAARPELLASLRLLIGAYNWIYGWQDRLVRRLDGWAVRPLTSSGRTEAAERLRDSHGFLTTTSALGPGLAILILDVYTLAGHGRLVLALELYLWTVAFGGTLLAAGLFVWLRRAASRLAGAAA